MYLIPLRLLILMQLFGLKLKISWLLFREQIRGAYRKLSSHG